MPELIFDFSVREWGGQFVWQGLESYSSLSSVLAFPSWEAAEDDACSVISDIFALTAESLSAKDCDVISTAPSLGLVPFCGGTNILTAAA